VVPEAHTVEAPDTELDALIVTIALLLQPVLNLYVTIAVPEAIPFTIPVAESTVTFDELLLHVPPDVLLASVVAEPAHTAIVPVTDAGSGLTVTIAVLVQPAPALYVTVVVPVVTPVTTPEFEPIVATLVLLLVHDTPELIELDSTVLPPTHTLVLPDIADEVEFTVITVVVKHPFDGV
jgi:hypothetical protein